jgi:hypothetical protein
MGSKSEKEIFGKRIELIVSKTQKETFSKGIA